jgi:DNA polymerase III epsilon subunit-like protein
VERADRWSIEANQSATLEHAIDDGARSSSSSTRSGLQRFVRRKDHRAARRCLLSAQLGIKLQRVEADPDAVRGEWSRSVRLDGPLARRLIITWQRDTQLTIPKKHAPDQATSVHRLAKRAEEESLLRPDFSVDAVN